MEVSLMPKQIFIPENDSWRNSGISITWTPSAERIDISGWYDGIVGIEGTSMTLQEFIDKLGIKEKSIRKLKWEERHGITTHQH